VLAALPLPDPILAFMPNCSLSMKTFVLLSPPAPRAPCLSLQVHSRMRSQHLGFGGPLGTPVASFSMSRPVAEGSGDF
jgi:hypothetical protein